MLLITGKRKQRESKQISQGIYPLGFLSIPIDPYKAKPSGLEPRPTGLRHSVQ